MDKNNHSKDRWELKVEQNCVPECLDWTTVRDKKSKANIANIYTPELMEEWDTISPSRRRANARLISAAPELLDALEVLLLESMAISKRVCDEYRVHYEPSTHEERAINAIKKARGE